MSTEICSVQTYNGLRTFIKWALTAHQRNENKQKNDFWTHKSSFLTEKLYERRKGAQKRGPKRLQAKGYIKQSQEDRNTFTF